MKIPIFITLLALFAFTNGVFVPPRPGHRKPHLLGAKECTWGPSYWCQNLTAAADCHATKHCIQNVWIHKELPPDSSSICQTCLDMVKQARDQLLSNDTQELIKEVFEGSCALLHIKPIVKECDKIADEYIPDLIDTLASQMNPQVVCSVAGLCNSEKVRRLIAESNGEVVVAKPAMNSCEGCHTVVELMENKFNKLSRDEVLQNFLQMCGKLGSFSDACSNIVVTYFTEIYEHIQNNFNSNDVCLMAGECSAQFHKHANVEITPISHIGYVQPEKEDLPCELCEQLVQHLRDLLVANTTEDEFKQVLKGLCNQTRSFQSECLSLVDQYYALIYNFLVSQLNSNEACRLIGICPNNITDQGPIAPLLTDEAAADVLNKKYSEDLTPLVHIKVPQDKSAIRVLPENSPLPIDLLMPPHTQHIYNKEVCVFCEYFLHFIQEKITSPASASEIKHIIDEACNHLPSSVNSTCIQFVDNYEPVLVAILAQEIDPSQVCPLIKACPSANRQDVEIFMQANNEDSPKCPLCLYAISKLESMIKNKKTKENIKDALSKLCIHMPNNLANECTDFVNTYTDELVEMMVADLKPDEVCVYLKVCKDDTPAPKIPMVEPIVDVTYGGDIETNIIPDNTINGNSLDVSQKPQCALCEFVMNQIEEQLKDKKTEDEIKNVVFGICKVLPSSLKKECKDFIDQYADTIIQLLIQALEPSDICAYLHFCDGKVVETMKGEILDCAVCEVSVEAMKKILSNPKADHKIEHVLEKTCRAIPRKYRKKCVSTIEENGTVMIDMIVEDVHPNVICHKIGQCASSVHRPLSLF